MGRSFRPIVTTAGCASPIVVHNSVGRFTAGEDPATHQHRIHSARVTLAAESTSQVEGAVEDPTSPDPGRPTDFLLPIAVSSGQWTQGIWTTTSYRNDNLWLYPDGRVRNVASPYRSCRL